jgi:hypothetical protein
MIPLACSKVRMPGFGLATTGLYDLLAVVNGTTTFCGFASKAHIFAIHFADSLQTHRRPRADADTQQNKGIPLLRRADRRTRPPVARTVVSYPRDSSL